MTNASLILQYCFDSRNRTGGFLKTGSLNRCKAALQERPYQEALPYTEGGEHNKMRRGEALEDRGGRLKQRWQEEAWTDLQEWAGVGGDWLCCCCFLPLLSSSNMYMLCTNLRYVREDRTFHCFCISSSLAAAATTTPTTTEAAAASSAYP
jgi:hypothetical protein